jgi:hypothetical protein
MEEILSKWDHKHTVFLKSFYQENISKDTFINDIIQIFLTNPKLEHATSWLLKHYFDQGETVEQEQIGLLLKKIEELTYWGSQLHLLQILPKTPLTEKQAALIEPTIRKLLNSENKFVKAAAYEAYFEVVKVFPDLKHEFTLICKGALARESAAVKVKIKRILREFNPK